MLEFGLDLTTRPDLPAVVARWQREISSDELRAGYRAILALADECGCPHWLLDLRRRENLASDEINAWMATQFLPLLVQRYARPVRIAFLISPRRAQQTPWLASAAAAYPVLPGLATADFTTEAAAYAWLAQEAAS